MELQYLNADTNYVEIKTIPVQKKNKLGMKGLIEILPYFGDCGPYFDALPLYKSSVE